LEPGGTKSVELKITTENLKYRDINMQYVADPGDYTVIVGTSSADKDLQSVTLTLK